MQHLSSSMRRVQLNKEYRRLFIRSRKGAFSFSCTSGSTLRPKNRWVRVGTMCRCLRNSREGTFSEQSAVLQLLQFCSSKFLFSFCRMVESFHLNKTKGKSRNRILNSHPYSILQWSFMQLRLLVTDGMAKQRPSCPYKRLSTAPHPHPDAGSADPPKRLTFQTC